MKSLVYVVHWEAEVIIKVGISGCRRWQQWIGRGARLVHLFTPDYGVPAAHIEHPMEVALSLVGQRAFRDRAHGRAFLAGNGGGWTECYRVRPDQVEHVLWALLPGIALSNASCTTTDVTDGLTKRVVTSRDLSLVSNAREPAGIHPSFAATRRPGRSAPGRINPKGALCG